MTNIRKKLVVVALTLCTMLCLVACGGSEEEDASALVLGNIDVIYQGKYDEEYLESVNSTKEEAEQDYLDGLELEAEFFANYWGIVDADYGEFYDDLDESLKTEIVDLYKEIYSHSKYEVLDAVKHDDGSYSVKVLVEPIDIMEQAYNLYENDEYAPLNDFWAKYEDTDFSAMTDEEYVAFSHEYGQLIVQLVKDQIPNLGYKEQQSLSIQVENDNGVQSINDDDWANFDSYVIYYP